MTTTKPAFSDPAEAYAFAQYRQAQEEEYTTWVAATDIYVGNALAYRPGHPVPKSNVERHGYAEQGLVVPAGTPIPEPGVDRQAQLAARRAELDRERAAIDAELAAAEAIDAPKSKKATKVTTGGEG